MNDIILSEISKPLTIDCQFKWSYKNNGLKYWSIYKSVKYRVFTIKYVIILHQFFIMSPSSSLL